MSNLVTTTKRPVMVTSYFPAYKSSSSNTATTATTATNGSSLPTTPRNVYGKQGNNTGYDSDSSDEGGRRPIFPQQGLTLRVANPDVCTTPSDFTNEAPQYKLELLPATYSNPNERHREPKTLVAAATMKHDIPENDTCALVDNEQQSTTPNTTVPNSPTFSDRCYSEVPSKTSTQLATEYAINNPSKYAKVSYHLTNDPKAIKLYREMAEKANDTTVQLMFAKYLLETANAFYPSTPSVVGSMWGLGTTTKKAQRPEPFLVVPSTTEEASASSSFNNNSVNFTNRNAPLSIDAGNSLHSSYTDRPSTIAATLRIKQQHQNDDRHTSHDPAAVDQTQLLKRKALEDEGVKWIRRLAKLNVAEACYMQAHWMDKEMYGFKQNKARSIQLHRTAAKADIPESAFALAAYLEEEEKVEPAVILKYYRSAAEQGYVNAIYKMALITLKGQLGVRQSLIQGLKLMYDACKVCTDEFSEPLFTFGLMLTNDDQGQVDVPSALSKTYGGKAAGILYYERAANLNNDRAQSKLGSIYEHGLYGESMNFARAFFHYEVGALNGNPKAMLGLCRLNNRGNHGPGDNNEAFRLENDVSGWLAATPINEDVSFQWCEKAARTGLVDALALLGWFYERGFGTPRDFSRAEKYYRMAADQGDAGAKSRLLQTNNSITKQQHEVISKSVKPIVPQPRKTKHQDFGKKKSNCYCM